MIYFLLGEDSAAKDQKIAEFKKKYLSSPEAFEFDYETLSAAKLDPDDLRKALIALPAFSKRLVLIRRAQALSASHRKIILEFVHGKSTHLVLILDADEADASQDFIRQLADHATVLNFTKGIKSNVFDMTNAMGAHNPSQALKLLSELLENGNHPLQIMGGIIWFWGKCRHRLPPADFQEGLRELKEADVNIKRSRLKPECALEILLVQLTGLLKQKSGSGNAKYK